MVITADNIIQKLNNNEFNCYTADSIAVVDGFNEYTVKFKYTHKSDRNLRFAVEKTFIACRHRIVFGKGKPKIETEPALAIKDVELVVKKIALLQIKKCNTLLAHLLETDFIKKHNYEKNDELF